MGYRWFSLPVNIAFVNKNIFLVHSWMKRQYSLNTFIEYIWECLYLLNIFWNRLINIFIERIYWGNKYINIYIGKIYSYLLPIFKKNDPWNMFLGKRYITKLILENWLLENWSASALFACLRIYHPPPSTRPHAGARTLTPHTVGRARTCLEMMSFPSGIGAPFSVAILFKVAMAFSWFPDSTSYLALSGSHCGDRCGRLGWNRTLGPSHILSPGCGVFKSGAFGARGLASNPGSVIEYTGWVTLSNYLTSLCLHFLIHKMGIMIDPIS